MGIDRKYVPYIDPWLVIALGFGGCRETRVVYVNSTRADRLDDALEISVACT